MSFRKGTFNADIFCLLISVVVFCLFLMHIVRGVVIGGDVVVNAEIIRKVVSV